jgi:hypothetical protein
MSRSSRIAHSRSWLPAVALFAVVGCSPYGQPDLGDSPFRCGTDEPRCPRGYECVTYSPAEEICEKEEGGSGPDAGQGSIDANLSNFVCNDDSSLEPNESPSQATFTPIPDLASQYELVNLAICPDADVDVFRFGTNQPEMRIIVDVAYEAAFGVLSLSILNSNGVAIAQGTPQMGNDDLLRAEIPFANIGVYYAEVKASGPGIRNNYGIHIRTVVQ